MGLSLVRSGNKYQSAEIPVFWQSPVYVYPSTVKAGLPQKLHWILNHLQPSSSFSLQHHVQTKRVGERGEKNGIRTGKDAAVNFTRVNNMGNGPGSSSHNMLNSPAKGGKWTLISTKELLLNDGYSAQFQFWHAKAVWGTQLLGSGMWAGVVGLFALLVLHGLSPAGL